MVSLLSDNVTSRWQRQRKRVAPYLYAEKVTLLTRELIESYGTLKMIRKREYWMN